MNSANSRVQNHLAKVNCIWRVLFTITPPKYKILRNKFKVKEFMLKPVKHCWNKLKTQINKKIFCVYAPKSSKDWILSLWKFQCTLPTLCFFAEMLKTVLKFTWNYKGVLNSQNNTEKEIRMEDSLFSISPLTTKL